MNDSSPNKVKETIPILIGVQLYNIHIIIAMIETLWGHLGEVKMTLHTLQCLPKHDIVADYQEVWGHTRCGRSQANWGTAYIPDQQPL